MAAHAKYLVLVTMVITATLTNAVLAAANATSTEQRVALNSDGDSLVVRPLDDPDNPYKDKYGPWDIWVWDNYHAGYQQGTYTFFWFKGKMSSLGPDGEPMPENWQHQALVVNEEGFAVPSTINYIQSSTYSDDTTVRELLYPERSSDAGVFELHATGVFPEGFADQKQQARIAAMAEVLPPIPAWLGEHPPLKTVFSPIGEFVTYGELDLHYRELIQDGNLVNASRFQDEIWYRYSADGELLGSFNKPGQRWTSVNSWAEVYCQEINNKTESARNVLTGKGRITTTHDVVHGFHGLFLIPDEESGTGLYPDEGYYERYKQRELVKAWDLFGNEIDPDTPANVKHSFLGQTYPRDWLIDIYSAQVKLGLTDPGAISTFAGKDNGPQQVDPTPRFPRLVAGKDSHYGDGVEVNDPDDPANPYFGEYQEWDYWLIEHVDNYNPREAEDRRIQHAELDKRVKEKIAAGESVTKRDRYVPPYRKPADDPWQKYTIYVTDEGWVIPAHHISNLEAIAMAKPLNALKYTRKPKPANYQLPAGGVMPDEIHAGYVKALSSPAITRQILVPDWLATAPVHYVLFVPNGDIITLGPLGFRTEENADTPLEELWADTPRAFYRFSPEGELLGTHETLGWDWQALYYPQWQALWTNATDSGLQARDRSGYLVIGDPATDTIKAVFDYDGTPIDPNGPVLRCYRYCRMHYWKSIEELVRVPAKGEPVNLHDVATGKETFSISVQ